uniref:Ubiquitin-like protease family profile domain-containing protein n=1 Tax=Brassica oleracea var. oleracea TaxID=109376 RepID=A0A0D3B8R4_BRAOL
MLGAHVEAGPYTQEIIAALERCEGWSRDDRADGSVKGRDISGCYTINGFAQALQVWVYTALPKLGATFGNPLPNNPSPPILAYKGRKGRKQFKEAILSQMRPQLCPQMLVPRKIKLQNRALFYWTKINPLFRIYRRRMLDIRKRRMLLWHFAVQRVIKQGNLLPHSNLLKQHGQRTIPSFCQSNKVWGTDIDDIYAPVNFADTHWIAMWISIPKRHIVVFDSICYSISPEELDVVMEPFLYMVPYLLVECASSNEQRAQYSLEQFTYERPTNIPPARAGDCGVYTLKYIECHALGIEFSKNDFAKANGKTTIEIPASSSPSSSSPS